MFPPILLSDANIENNQITSTWTSSEPLLSSGESVNVKRSNSFMYAYQIDSAYSFDFIKSAFQYFHGEWETNDKNNITYQANILAQFPNEWRRFIDILDGERSSLKVIKKSSIQNLYSEHFDYLNDSDFNAMMSALIYLRIIQYDNSEGWANTDYGKNVKQFAKFYSTQNPSSNYRDANLIKPHASFTEMSADDLARYSLILSLRSKNILEKLYHDGPINSILDVKNWYQDGELFLLASKYGAIEYMDGMWRITPLGASDLVKSKTHVEENLELT